MHIKREQTFDIVYRYQGKHLMDKILIDLDSTRVRELTESMPTKKRSAWGKALQAAAQFVKDSNGNYQQAFELAREMLRNE